MLYTPKREGTKLSLLALSLLLCGTLLSFFGARMAYGAILQALALLFFSAFLFLCIRYVLPQYLYELSENTLAVTRRMGKRIQTLCRLDLSELSAVTAQKHAPKKGGYDLCYNFRQNLFAKQQICLTLVFNQKRALILLEYDPELFKALKKLVPENPENPTNFDAPGKI